jgi:hypothetical protein
MFQLQTFLSQHCDVFDALITTALTPRSLQTLRCASKLLRQIATEEARRKCVEAAVERYTRATLTRSRSETHQRGLRLHSRYGEHAIDLYVWSETNRAGQNCKLKLKSLTFFGEIGGLFWNPVTDRWHIIGHQCMCVEPEEEDGGDDHQPTTIINDTRVKGVWISSVKLFKSSWDPESYDKITLRVNIDFGPETGVMHTEPTLYKPAYGRNTFQQEGQDF